MRHLISSLIVVFLLTLATALQAGYVWQTNASGDPNSTSDPPWTSDASVTDRLVSSGNSNVFQVTSGDINLYSPMTIQTAKVTTAASQRFRFQTNSSLTINNGGSLTANYGLWMFGSSTAPATLTINQGGSFSVGGSSSYVSDGSACKVLIDVNGGYIESTSGTFCFGHHGPGEMTVRNSGSTSFSNIAVGGGDNYTNSNERGLVTIGTLNSTTDASHFKAATMTIGNNSVGRVVLNSGKLEVTSALSVGNLLGSTLESHGGTMTIKQLNFAIKDVTADPNKTISYMNLENTKVNISENLFFGKLGKAEGTVTNSDFTVKYLHVGGENADAAGDKTGTGRGNLTFKDCATVNITNSFGIYRGSVTFNNSTATVGTDFYVQSRAAGVSASLNVTNGSKVSGKVLQLQGSTVAGSQDATLTVSSGASLTLTGANFSNSPTGGTKTLIDGGTLTITGGATVANQAPAEFIAQNGAKVSVTNDFVIGSSGTATMTIDNSSVEVNRYTQIGTGSKSSTEPTTLTLQNGATLNAKNGFWLNKSTSHPTTLNVLSGSKLTFSADSYFGDRMGADANTVLVDGGTVESTTNALRIAWWGGCDTTVRNGGLIKSTDLLIGNQYGETSTSGKATVLLENGGKLQAKYTLTIGNANRKADVTIKAGPYGGFGSMEATTINLSGVNLTIDASPLMFLTDYDATTGTSLVKATNLNGWTEPTLTSDDWEIVKAGGNISLKHANSSGTSLGTLTVSGSPLTFASAAAGQLDFVNETGSDFYLEFTTTGLDSQEKTELFVAQLNEELDGVTAAAAGVNRIVLKNFAESFTNGVFLWDFTTIQPGVTAEGAKAYLPEPATWLLLVLGVLLLKASPFRKVGSRPNLAFPGKCK